MKIIRKGSVTVGFLSKSELSIKNKLFCGKIHYFSLDKVYCKLSGDKKIIIKLSNEENLNNPTIISTGYDWKSFNGDDDIAVAINNPNSNSMQITVCFYNTRNSENQCCLKRVK